MFNLRNNAIFIARSVSDVAHLLSLVEWGIWPYRYDLTFVWYMSLPTSIIAFCSEVIVITVSVCRHVHEMSKYNGTSVIYMWLLKCGKNPYGQWHYSTHTSPNNGKHHIRLRILHLSLLKVCTSPVTNTDDTKLNWEKEVIEILSMTFGIDYLFITALTELHIEKNKPIGRIRVQSMDLVS